MKKKLISIMALFLSILFCTSPVFALTVDSDSLKSDKPTTKDVAGKTTLELVEKKLCEIPITDPTTNDKVGEFTKELTNFDATKREATLTLTVKNLMAEETVKKPVEIFLILDNSTSMTKEYNSKNKIDYVSQTAATFADSMFDYFENLKMGIISFSCAELRSAAGTAFHDGTLEDAVLTLPLSDSKENVKSKIEEYNNGEHGIHTNIDAGISLADANFTNSEETEKYIILLSDGVPNLCLDTQNTLLYSGVVASTTKQKLQAIEEKGYHLFSVLMGLYEKDVTCPAASVSGSVSKTYHELSEEVFGTIDNPTAGKFYYIDYENLDTTINKDIYGEITYQKDTSLKNVSIKDYFPKEIIENFNFEYVTSPNIGSISEKVDYTDNSITWDIELLKPGEVATVSYKLTLKDDYNKEIVDKILPTNTMVDIDYEYDNQKDTASSTVSSTVRVRYVEPNKDETIAKDPIPQTGNYIKAILVCLIIIMTVIAITRYNSFRKIK